MAGPVRIQPVKSHGDIKKVVTFPFSLYRSDPYWVPPLIADKIKHLDPEHNPFFEHAEMQLFRAVRDGETVGTIAAIENTLHQEIWDEPVGFFGVFETIEDYAVAQALFDAAGQWLAARGLNVMRGPMNLNINDEAGLLIDGFDGSPVIMMPYNKRYYEPYIERYGFAKAKDLYAFSIDIYRFGPDAQGIPARLARLARVATERYDVQVRPMNIRDISGELELVKPIYRQAWAKNWGALPMTDAEFEYLANELKGIVDPDLTFLAFIDGEPVGCFITLPDYYQILHYANGHVLPFGWAKLLWHRKKIDTVRVLIMGVLAEHRLKGIEALFYQRGCEIAYKKGYRQAEMSWLLENNVEMIRSIERMGGEIYRTYRLYDRTIAP